MTFSSHRSAEAASAAAADTLAAWLTDPETRTTMVAAGNSPLDLYRRIAARQFDLSHLEVFALDEYVGVPRDDPRTCGNVLQREVGTAWKIPTAQFHSVNPSETDALASVRAHEEKVAASGGLDAVVLGLGQNGHLGFNEPGSAEDSTARVLELDPVSIAANRLWFGGDYAPARGATVGLRTILSARHVLLVAFGAHKATAVRAMREGPRTPTCPASLLQGHRDTRIFLDTDAASLLQSPA